MHFRLCYPSLSPTFHFHISPQHAQPRNDIKLSLRHSKGQLFKVLLSYALFFNVNYGPAGTKKWLLKKQQERHHWLQRYDADSEIFLTYLPYICKELQVQEPSSWEGRNAILERIQQMETLQVHGPITKLMRWFSWWESFSFYKNEIWLNKMLMSSGASPEKGVQDHQHLDPELLSGELSHKEELNKLKASLGTWALAPLLVTPASFMKCQILKRVVDPLWTVYSKRAKHCTTPDHVQADFVFFGCVSYDLAQQFLHSCSLFLECSFANFRPKPQTPGQNTWLTLCNLRSKASSTLWASEIHDLMVNGFFGLVDVYRFDCEPGSQASLVDCHFDVLVKLMNKRCQSLTATYLLPPLRYAGVLDPAKALETQQIMLREWNFLLKAPLQAMNWRLATLPRLCFLASERSLEEVANIMKCCTNHIGDSALVENVHNQAKAS